MRDDGESSIGKNIFAYFKFMPQHLAALINSHVMKRQFLDCTGQKAPNGI
jgi:hypothetical protein